MQGLETAPIGVTLAFSLLTFKSFLPTANNAALEITDSHQSMTWWKRSMTGSNFLQPINHILNLTTRFDNVSLFYENIHISSQKPHRLSTFQSFWKDILGKNYPIKTKIFSVLSFRNGTGIQYTVWPASI